MLASLLAAILFKPMAGTEFLVLEYTFMPGKDTSQSSRKHRGMQEKFHQTPPQSDNQISRHVENLPDERNEDQSAPKSERAEPEPSARPQTVEVAENPAGSNHAPDNLLMDSKGTGNLVALDAATKRPGMPLTRPSYMPENPAAPRRHAVAYAGFGGTSYLSRPRLRKNEPGFVSLMMPMPAKERKRIAKKIRKLATRVLPKLRADSSLVWHEKGKVYHVRIRNRPARATTGLDEILVEVSTEEDGFSLTTAMRMRRLAFSSYAQFVDYWDPHVALHDDELEGRFHSNSAITVSSRWGVQPKFHGKVTTAAYDVRISERFPYFDNEAVFLAGLETGVKEIRLPRNLRALYGNTTVADSSSHVLAEEAWITFHANGSYSWQVASNPGRIQRRRLPSEPFFIIGENRAKIHVQGVVRGKVLVYCEKKIIIDGSVTYARNPEFMNSDDYLGLVCKKDIEIAHPSITGPGDLKICAAVLARGRFRVRHLYGNGRAKLIVYGSLSAGSISATEPRYATHLVFDKRFERHRPPNFPMTEKYEVVEWDKQWRIVAPATNTNKVARQ